MSMTTAEREALRGDILVLVVNACASWRDQPHQSAPTLQLHIARAVFAWAVEREGR